VAGETQSLSAMQAALHDVALAQTRPPGQADVVPLPHAPPPLQVPAVVSWAPLHEGLPHEVLLPGNTHAPVDASQPVAPQAPPAGMHVDPQQSPVPAMPHTPLLHWSFAVQAPAVSLGAHAAAPGAGQ